MIFIGAYDAVEAWVEEFIIEKKLIDIECA